MVKEAIIMKYIIELENIEIAEACIINIQTGEKEFYKGEKRTPGFTGFYFRDNVTFFALYPTPNGPMMYYDGREFPLKKDLHISLTVDNRDRKFLIKEYDICIKYKESPYIAVDFWSTEEEVDLFYQIEQHYKDDEYYAHFTKE